MLGFFKKKTRKAVIEVKKILPFLRRQLQLCLRFLRLLVKLPK